MSTRRHTRQRAAVEAMLTQIDGFRTAQEIHALLRESGEEVGLTTVYRSLAMLAEDGAVDVLLAEDGEALYRACGSGHHHHLVCRECGFTVEVTATSVERWAARTAAEHGFADVAHTMEIMGTCRNCVSSTGNL